LNSASAAPYVGTPLLNNAAASFVLFLAGEKQYHVSYIVKPTSPVEERSFG
jgi:hypothetical protein